MATALYHTSRWRQLRARILERDNRRCLFHRLGGCQGPLHVHHLTPVTAGGNTLDENHLETVCQRHHPMLEAVQRRSSQWRRCPHKHRYQWARVECERRLNREYLAA
jgi:hypothetical protein